MARRKPWADREGSGRGGRPWRRIRAARFALDKGMCQPCLAKGRVTPATEVHHIKGVVQGGTDDQENLISMCGTCHEEADAANKGQRKVALRRVGLDGYPIAEA